MPRFALLTLSLLFACAEETTIKPEPETPITGACVRSFFTTLQAWEEASLMSVPEECRYLDADYTVERVGEVVCDMEPRTRGTLTIGCTLPKQHAIQILDTLDDVAAVDTSIHEWLHALAYCVYGDQDAEHLRAGVWVQYGPKSAESTAWGNVTLGQCDL